MIISQLVFLKLIDWEVIENHWIWQFIDPDIHNKPDASKIRELPGDTWKWGIYRYMILYYCWRSSRQKPQEIHFLHTFWLENSGVPPKFRKKTPPKSLAKFQPNQLWRHQHPLQSSTYKNWEKATDGLRIPWISPGENPVDGIENSPRLFGNLTEKKSSEKPQAAQTSQNCRTCCFMAVSSHPMAIIFLGRIDMMERYGKIKDIWNYLKLATNQPSLPIFLAISPNSWAISPWLSRVSLFSTQHWSWQIEVMPNSKSKCLVCQYFPRLISSHMGVYPKIYSVIIDFLIKMAMNCHPIASCQHKIIIFLKISYWNFMKPSRKPT